MIVTKAPLGLGLALFLSACSNESPSPADPSTGGAPTGGTSTGGVSGDAGTAGSVPTGGTGAPGGSGGAAGSSSTGGSATGGNAGNGGAAPTWGIEARPTGQTCLPPASMAEAAMLLSATGCVDPTDPKRPAATLIPYGVATPLWSDAATKHRYFALPDGETIDVKDCTRDPASCMPDGTPEDEGDWSFPVNTVFVKTFAFGDKLVETRLLVRMSEFDFWGFSYQWRDDQTDADLLAVNIEGYDKEVQGPDGMQTWHFPSRQQCLQCHTTPAGVSLGPETSQLNTDFTYPNGVTGNQLDTLEHIGVFTNAPARRPAYPSPTDTSAPVAERARSYLQANCSMCHRPGSNFTGFDARFSVPFADMNLCNAVPEKGDLGVMGALRITPGAPDTSLVSIRMHRRDAMTQMPQIGTNEVDQAGVDVIDEWITSLTGCP